MRKLFGLKIGGLQNKILNLVLLFMLVTIAFGMAVSVYRTKQLGKIVGEAKEEQHQAIVKESGETMHLVLESSLNKTNALQAYIADEMFMSVKKDVSSLKTLAEGIFEHKDSLLPEAFSPPDPSSDGQITAQVLWEDGVDYTKSELLPIASHMIEPMKALFTNSYHTTNCYIGLADGTHLCIDDIASNKFDENGNILTFPVRQRPWYTAAVEKGDICFTDAMLDLYTGDICVTCSAPVYAGGRLIGVVGMDLFLNDMSAYVNQSAGNGAFICVISNEGKVLFAPENNGLFEVKTEGAEDLRNSSDSNVSAVVNTALRESTGLRTLSINGKDYYMAGSPLGTVGWAVISVVEKDITDQPAEKMIGEFDRINGESSARYDKGTDMLKTQTLVFLALILIVGSAAALIVAARIVKPIESMTEEIVEGGRSGKLFEMKDIYKTGDEIEILAESFDDLSKKTKQYIIDITRITKEKERIGTELDLARKIQADMLPNIYPAFPDRAEFDIYATMTPAKEVGGDFYDFFLIDDDHLGMVVADVSGKGVPAALFMMMSKILINNFAMQGASPSKVLEMTNTVICQNNEEEMFVTVWFGVLQISTGMITAANAGHEYPVVRKADGEFELYKDKHGFVVGGMPGMKYKEYEFQLEKGGALFLYTDGVPEAKNGDEVLFGTERLLEAVNKDPLCDPQTLLKNVKSSVDEFVGVASQFDDLTMLGLTLR